MRRIIMDCDPGHDDAIALFMALASPEIEVLGITTTHGNVGLNFTTRNALIVNTWAETRVPVYAGASLPLLRSPVSAKAVHGQSGLSVTDLPEPTQNVQSLHAVDFMAHTFRQNPHNITLVATGPLTNVALLFRMYPDIIPLIPELVIMGGSLYNGNVTASAEFNTYADPHAAQIVFQSGVPIKMFGLNLTMQVLATAKHVKHLQNSSRPIAHICAELISHYQSFYLSKYGLQGAALHDPCTIAYLIQPELFTGQNMQVNIDTSEGLNFGRTVCDQYAEPNAWVAEKADVEGFFALLYQLLA